MSDKLKQTIDVAGSWTGAIATITLGQINTAISICVGVATLGYTLHRWCYWHRTKKDK